MNKKLFSMLMSGLLMSSEFYLPVIANELEPFEEVETTSTQEMYRLYNRQTGEHFYTGNANEKNTLVKGGWRYEGIGWYAPSSSNTPVYRLYNQNSKDHHYTTNGTERDTLIRAGWKDEGISWYSDDSQRVPLYRQYNPNARTGNHNYTTDKGENDQLCRMGWKAEGIGWYGIKKGEPAPVESVNYEALYHPILDEVKKIWSNKGNGNYYNSEFEGVADASYFDGYRSALGYTIQDFSGDGIPELVIGISNYDGNILGLYTLVNNTPVNVFHGRIGGTRYYYGGNSTFTLEAGTGAGYPIFGQFSLSKDGRNKVYSEYYYNDPYGPSFYLTTDPNLPGKYIGGVEAFETNFNRISVKKQKMNLTPISQWK